jgi:hypothetical protein
VSCRVVSGRQTMSTANVMIARRLRTT